MGARHLLVSSRQPGGLTVIQNLLEHPGNVWFVDSTNSVASDAVGSGQSPDTPFATLGFAISQCTPSKGDTVVLMPGHAETIITAAQLNINVAGIRIVGLGDRLLRPTFTLQGVVGATITVSAANVLLRNLRILSNLASVAVGLTATAAAIGLTVQDCEFKDGGSSKQLLVMISIAALCTDVRIERCRFYASSGSSSTEAILLAGAADRFILLDNQLFGEWTGAAVLGTAAASVLVEIGRNVINNDDTTAGLCVSLHASTTGLIHENRMTGQKSTVIPVSASGCGFHQSFVADGVNKHGVVKPVVTSTI